jgi:hypothetical protein
VRWAGASLVARLAGVTSLLPGSSRYFHQGTAPGRSPFHSGRSTRRAIRRVTPGITLARRTTWKCGFGPRADERTFRRSLCHGTCESSRGDITRSIANCLEPANGAHVSLSSPIDGVLLLYPAGDHLITRATGRERVSGPSHPSYHMCRISRGLAHDLWLERPGLSFVSMWCRSHATWGDRPIRCASSRGSISMVFNVRALISCQRQ